MPPTANTNSPALAVEISSPHDLPLFANGLLIGNVVRRSALVSPHATVTLTLYGRAKTKIVVRRSGNNSSRRDVYRSRVNFFAGAPRHVIHHIVFQGPLHVPSGAAAEVWPFEMTIPGGPMIALGKDEMEMTETTLMSLSPEDVAHHALPASFSSADRGFRTSSEAYVEYHLEAVMRYTHGGSAETTVATCPFFIAQPGTPQPINNFEKQQRSYNHSVKSHLLVPGMEKGSLSFKQKSQHLFSSSKVPEYHFMVQVDAPRVLQLDNPNPLPLGLRVVPRPQATSSIIEGVSYPVTLNAVSFNIKRETYVVAPGNWSGRRHDHTHQSEAYFGLENAFRMFQRPIVLPSGPEAEPLDLGTILQLSLRTDGLYAAGTRLANGPMIQPDFVTYNIRQTSTIKWKIHITVAGEEQTIKLEGPVTILGPAEQAPMYNMQPGGMEPGGMESTPAPLYSATPAESAPAYNKSPQEQTPAYSEITSAAGPSSMEPPPMKGEDMEKKVVDAK